VSNVTVVEWREWKNAPTDPPTTVIQAGIDAAEEAIGADLARYIAVASGTATARVYVPAAGSDTLRIHDCKTITSVTESGTLLAASGYLAHPVTTWSGAVEPFTEIQLLGGVTFTDTTGSATISVVADWGWAALPFRYVEAVKILSADIIDQKDIRNGVAGFADFGAVRVRENATVVKLLARLRRAESWGIA